MGKSAVAKVFMATLRLSAVLYRYIGRDSRVIAEVVCTVIYRLTEYPLSS